MTDESLSPVEKAQHERYEQDVFPVTLPVLRDTWTNRKLMGIDLDAGIYEYLNEGTHIWESYFRHWGWWKTIVLGWYPYTDLRDVHSHERQGIGRPWLRLLSEDWQALIFRELIMLVGEWNKCVDENHLIVFSRDEKYPMWVERWLSLTNQSWRQGANDLEREAFDALRLGVNAPAVAKLVQRYNSSAMTWRPMMPERAEYHQRYGDRSAYWSFERS